MSDETFHGNAALIGGDVGALPEQVDRASPAEARRGRAAGEKPWAGDGTAPNWLFPVLLAWLVGLAALAVAYGVSAELRSDLPKTLWGLPIGVPWFGAIGGTLASLAAVGKYTSQWRTGSGGTHAVRPLVAAITGVLAAIMLKLLVDLGTGGSGVKLDSVTYDLIAFIAGYRDETFRLMVKRATDALLVPGSKTPPSTQTSAKKH